MSILGAIKSPLDELPVAKKGVKALLDVCKNGGRRSAGGSAGGRAGRGLSAREEHVICARARSAPLTALPSLPHARAEDNLDAAAQEGAVGAVVPLLNALSGGGAELAMEQPSPRCGGRPRREASQPRMRAPHGCLAFAGGGGTWGLQAGRRMASCMGSTGPCWARPGRAAAAPSSPRLACTSCAPPAAGRRARRVEELERDICFILGLLAIKVDHQQAICKHGALPTLVAMIKRYAAKNDIHLTGIPAQTCRRTADAITNLAHENNDIKNKVRQEGGVPPLVQLLHSIDPKVQRAVAGSLRTLAFKNEDNKQIIVELGSLPLLIQMLRAEDSTIHYEASGARGGRGAGWAARGGKWGWASAGRGARAGWP